MDFAKPVADLVPLAVTEKPARGQGLPLNDEYYIETPARWSGQEITYAEITADVTINQSTDALAVTVVNAPVIEYDGKLVLIEFFCEEAKPPDVDGGALTVTLWDDTTDLGRLWTVRTAAVMNGGTGVHAARRLQPTRGYHAFKIKAFNAAGVGNGTIVAGPGTAGDELPAFVRISRAGVQ